MSDPHATASDDAPLPPDPLEQAKAELAKARACYENVRQEVTEQLKAVRAARVGDIIDATLNAVGRHPAAGLTIAALLGFFLGRRLRR